MEKEYSFPPYGKELEKAIEKFGGKKMGIISKLVG